MKRVIFKKTVEIGVTLRTENGDRYSLFTRMQGMVNVLISVLGLGWHLFSKPSSQS